LQGALHNTHPSSDFKTSLLSSKQRIESESSSILTFASSARAGAAEEHLLSFFRQVEHSSSSRNSKNSRADPQAVQNFIKYFSRNPQQ